MKNHFLLFLIASIWGTGFLFQKTAMDNLSPLYFNGLRFLLSSIIIFPFIGVSFYRQSKSQNKRVIFYGMLLGIILFFTTYFQQLGIWYSTVSKSAFLINMAVCFIPIFSFFFGKKIFFNQYFGIAIALTGCYLLSEPNSFKLTTGDTFLLLAAACWGIQILLIDNLICKIKSILQLAFIQFFITSLGSFVVAIYTEDIALAQINNTITQILYAGILTGAIAYSLQLKAQKNVHPVTCSLIYSFQTFFAIVLAYYFLNETISLRDLVGGSFILLAVVFCQITPKTIYQSFKKKKLLENKTTSVG